MYKIDCIHYIDEQGGRCKANPPPNNEERLWMFLTCKLVGEIEGKYCSEKEIVFNNQKRPKN